VLFILNKAYYFTNIECNVKIKMEYVCNVLGIWILHIKSEQKAFYITNIGIAKNEILEKVCKNLKVTFCIQ
jgi:hypothetical protein